MKQVASVFVELAATITTTGRSLWILFPQETKLDISKRFKKNLLEDVKDDDAHTQSMLSLFNLLKELSTHPNILLEIFGCYRHFGHPTVDEPEGIKALKDNSRLELPLDKCMRKCLVCAISPNKPHIS